MSERNGARHARVVIIGTGFAGLGMAIELQKAGIHDFVILEKASDIGGTWRENSYPGCACDIPSHMYSFSFAQNPNWTRAYSPQPEIWDYLLDVTKRYGLREHIRFGVEVTDSRWDGEEQAWHVHTKDGAEFVGQFLVSGIGGLHIPSIPALPGLDRFQGVRFHSAQWDHGYDLTGKRVAVIGTGASAIQIVPKIAPTVGKLSLFQRTPPWIMPKPDHPMPDWSRRLFRLVPPAQRAYRALVYWMLEVRAVGFNGHPLIMRAGELVAKRHMRRQIEDRALRRKLTPRYRMGCKRVLLANDYYPALTRDNVDMVTDRIIEVREHGIVTADGAEHEVDAIIFGTGFHVTDSFESLDILGADGRNLSREWTTNGIRTHFGITVSGFPNLFFLLGPNTAVGHNSVVFMIESQTRYVSQAIKLVDRSQAGALDVRESVQDRFQEDVQRKLVNGVWTKGGCVSWYLDSHGVNRTIWPGFTWRYWMDTRSLRPSDFELVGRRS
jgi:cation diffusion facilitator CzcD-associated flavoprotein CzcO